MQRFSALSRSVVRANIFASRRAISVGHRAFSSTPRYMYAEAKEGKDAKKEDTIKDEGKKDAKDSKETRTTKDDVDAQLDETNKSLEELKKQNAELKDRYVRAVAEFRNLQATTQREMKKARDFALQKFSKDLIETVDNFDHAIEAVAREELKSNNSLSSFYDGVKMTKDVLEKTLEKHGLKKIDPLDKEFDPNKHEAVFQVAVPGKEPGTVCMVQQPGYELNGRVLRAAKVGVAKAADN
ncbi:hypothetical protein FOA43_000260 [Brettanomyces nanus]|uniref:GrpE protein homolog n=1 Tax=Eeniella nana TaxID=13502 RepID=A0A875RW40_EENNA|nr:uncharacterized protein FOA43_000260 [Brettanomyces nanus]QPG72956.1 hypothetical protein FOA43_000260 [Brettanomyces nanus]